MEGAVEGSENKSDRPDLESSTMLWAEFQVRQHETTARRRVGTRRRRLSAGMNLRWGDGKRHDGPSEDHVRLRRVPRDRQTRTGE
jgi:hypothetical protein